MRERLRVHPVEASVILLNEIFRRLPHNPEVAIVLHGYGWKKQYYLDEDSIRPENFLPDSQRSQLLLDSVTMALNKITERERRFVRLRFGFEDSTIHTLEEIGSEFGMQRERPRQIIAKALRRLRQPSRSSGLKQFLPENL